VKVGGPSVEFATIDEGTVWISDPDANSVVRVEAETTSVVARIPVGLAPKGGTAADGSVWVALEHEGAVARIDPATNTVAAKIRVGPEGLNGPLAVAEASGSIWVSVPVQGEVVQIDPETNRVTSKLPVAQPCVFAATAKDLWLSGCGRTEVTHLDPETGTLSVTADLSPDMPGAPALDAPDLWAVTFMANLVKIDVESGDVAGMMPLQGHNVEGESAAMRFGSLWIRARDMILRLGVG
jgi:streptogramin lyase